MKCKRVGLLCGALMLAAVLAACSVDEPVEPGEGDVPFLRTPGWLPRTAIYPGPSSGGDGPGVVLKRERAMAGALLFKHDLLPAVWRYDPQDRTLDAASDADWRNARGEPRNCSAPPWGALPLSMHPKTDRLILGIVRFGSADQGFDLVPFVGDGILDLRAAPSETMAAVHSADGPRGDPGISFFAVNWQGHFMGQHYHQIFSLPDGRPLGKPLRIPVRLYKTICWSADEAFVVYINEDLTNVVVVHVSEQGGS